MMLAQAIAQEAWVNWHTVFFYLFAALSCVFAVSVLVSSNIVRMAFYLILSLGAASGLFFLAGAHFVGAMQLMIYVGGTLVLLIFGVMLTAQQAFITMKISRGEWALAGVVGGSLLLLMVVVALSVRTWYTPRADADQIAAVEVHTTTRIGQALVGVRPERLDPANQARQAGMSGYLLPFTIVSIHLLVVLVGAAYLARTKRRAAASGLERFPTGHR